MLVIAANSLCGEPCGQPLTFDLSLGKSKSSVGSSKVCIVMVPAERYI